MFQQMQAMAQKQVGELCVGIIIIKPLVSLAMGSLCTSVDSYPFTEPFKLKNTIFI